MKWFKLIRRNPTKMEGGWFEMSFLCRSMMFRMFSRQCIPEGKGTANLPLELTTPEAPMEPGCQWQKLKADAQRCVQTFRRSRPGICLFQFSLECGELPQEDEGTVLTLRKKIQLRTKGISENRPWYKQPAKLVCFLPVEFLLVVINWSKASHDWTPANTVHLIDTAILF